MARVFMLLSVIFISVYVTEQAYFLQEDFINNINEQATTWKVCTMYLICFYQFRVLLCYVLLQWF